MVRSSFIKQLFGGFLLSVAGRYGTGHFGNAQKTLIYRHALNGTYYYDVKLVSKKMTTGSPLTLKREPNNIHDFNAIAVFFEDFKLGYIPRRDNVILSRMLDLHCNRFSAVAHEIKFYNDDYTDVVVSIFENVNHS